MKTEQVLQFNTMYRDEETGFYEHTRAKIAKQYMKTKWFYIDFVSCLPFAYVDVSFGNDDLASNTRTSKLFRLARLPRLLRLARAIKLFKKCRLPCRMIVDIVFLGNCREMTGIYRMFRKYV